MVVPSMHSDYMTLRQIFSLSRICIRTQLYSDLELIYISQIASGLPYLLQ
jgi:hypothetical protein